MSTISSIQLSKAKEGTRFILNPSNTEGTQYRKSDLNVDDRLNDMTYSTNLDDGMETGFAFDTVIYDFVGSEKEILATKKPFYRIVELKGLREIFALKTR